ncbi:hypothetical protein [Tessaracoccus sp. ZS01]|uniref:hypothetical protein n=1 Tax=Tessaracoccus sp. ZS01 TaxID=1906324 RepID=UPI00096BDAC2|nr:hypothetical protein [Tessaracoccus sp. ZS01]MCG6566894.1 hypothetical protein [Tessaracoccus sp. ZS01]OMG58024.1 hypothetical protein BJN44_04520 [Tessaracoccus sp. ZS01]
MAEHVVPLELGVTWEPNAPSAILVSNDFGSTALALKAHPDDRDQRCLVMVWTGSRYSSLSDPNDEAIRGHRLHRKGLRDVLWVGLVHESERIAELERQNRVHPLHDPSRFSRLSHHVLLLKECVIEVVAEDVSVLRTEGSTLQAAFAGVGS